MPGPGPLAATYSFGAFEIDTRSGELRKHGIRIKLQDQPRQILLLLLQQPGDIATREQIQKRLWADDTFVDFDNAINSAVRKLRDALGDSAENPRFVETLARRGYRFVAPVSTPANPALPSETLSVAADAKHGRGPTVAAVAILSLTTALAGWLFITRNPTGFAELRATPLTASTDLEVHPSFSPDGTRVAYSSSGDNGKHFAVYVKLIGPGDPVQITKDQTRDFSPAWSPDGRWIALLRDLGREAAILLIPASGGQPRELARVIKMRGDENCVQMTIICGVGFRGTLLAWSPDGKYLFTSGRPEPAPALTVMRISMETGEQQPVTSPPRGSGGDVGAAVSPDGRVLAFIRLSGLGAGDIYVASLSGGIASQPKRITTDGADLDAPAWTPNGRELIFSSDRGGRRELWRIAASGSAKPVRVAGIGENASDAAISPLGRRLVYGRLGYTGSLWRIPVGTAQASEPVRVMASTGRVSYPHYSPDGTRIAFQSARLGVMEIWQCGVDGTNSVQLTAFGRGSSGSPRWSPDGRTIAFDSNVAGNWDIYTIAAQGGRPIRVTTNQASDAIPNWSRDGRWIYFSSLRTGRPEVWKIRPDGTSEMQVTTTGGWVAAESADGKFLYYKYPSTDTADVWRMPVGGGPSTKILEGVRGRLVTVTEHGIYFPAGDPVLELRYLDFARHSIRAIANLGESAYATVSNDEQSALYTRNASLGANLIVVENFR